MVRRNQFIDDDNLSELSSLTHLLERNDNDDNEETPVLQHSPYYSDNQFIDIISKDTGLSILDMNICNAFTKFDELEIFIQRVNVSNPVSIICLNECWLSDQSDVSILHLPNYNMFYQVGKCPGHSHCGLITYVHDSFKSEKVNIDQITTGWEHLTVEVSHNTQNAKKYIISNMYRPPERYVIELDLFISEFSQFIDTIRGLKRSSFICGDFNINLLDINSNDHVNEYFESICSRGFFPRITLPTRIQPPSFSLIDNIITNDIDKTSNSISGLLINDLSDHKIIFTFHKNKSYFEKINKFIEVETRDARSINNFVNELKDLKIYDQLDKQLTNDPNANYELFNDLLNNARAKHLPKKRVKYQKKLHKKSKWITNGILNSINKKDKLYKTLIQTDTNNTILYERLKTEFNEYRAGLRKTIRKAKRDFYIHIYNRHKNDIKKTWSLINETLNRNLRKQSTYEFLVDDQMISNPVTIANKFNEYFAHIGSTLADKIPAAPHFNNYLNNPVETKFSFQTITENKVSKIINKLKNKVSYGYMTLFLISCSKGHMIL